LGVLAIGIDDVVAFLLDGLSQGEIGIVKVGAGDFEKWHGSVGTATKQYIHASLFSLAMIQETSPRKKAGFLKECATGWLQAG